MDGIVEEAWRSERRMRLLEAAGRVFSRHSYAQASMDEIAHEAGVGKPTLYRYFSGKDELFAAVFVEALDDLEDRLAAVLRRERGVEARLRGLVATLIPTVRDHLVSLRFLGEDAAALDQSKRRIFRDRKARLAGFLATAIEDGAKDGEVRSIDAIQTANLMVGMIWSGTAAIDAADDVIAQVITDLALKGIGLAEASEPEAWHRRAALAERSASNPGRTREAISS